ncbi:putative tyrosinase [Burkholderia sp. 8Y]|uniref:tyrosinase family protein n=1 Tax=Burkholderia sp. 8Y TaxID=2653133 RepID=UPI0012F00666|nr:tyrosinase family protein [Burkholderia sp. 8Y]VXC93282.1 putative tyrosinase [Burkholderia sp. 8Y]
MATTSTSRRAFVQGTSAALALATLPRLSVAQTPTVIRLEWQAFKITPQYQSYLSAIQRMKSFTSASDNRSWQYWANIHANYCPHSKAYFLAWHRGLLSLYEKQLRTASGDSKIAHPYWDYYTYPIIPSEFTDKATGNPLYTPRVNTSAWPALSMTPFGTGVTNFQFGLNNAFETNLENAPHDPVHDIIGGYLADIATAALDPLFYLHHTNLDRLWNAWSRRSTSRLPAATNTYWNGQFTYASGLTMSRSLTRTVAGLNYDYANDNMPTGLPPQAQQGRIIRVQAQVTALQVRPKLRTFPATPGRTVSSNRLSLGGLTTIPLDNNSISAGIPLQSSSANALRDALATSPAADLSNPAAGAANGQAQSPAASQGGGQAKNAGRYVKLVLDGLNASPAGQAGGYFYNIYVNLPPSGDVDAVGPMHFAGTIGAFEVSVAVHHAGGKKEFDITYLLASLGVTDLSQVVVSFSRINGLNAAQGNVVSIGEMRVELGTDAP